MRNSYLSLTLVAVLSVMYSPAYGAEPLAKYITNVPNCTINMHTKASCNSDGSLCLGMTTIGGCKAGELTK